MKPSHEWLNELVAETREGLARYLRRFCASPDDVQDVLQEAYLQVFCVLRKSGPDGHVPAALLYTTARNLAISRLRHLKVVAASAAAVSAGEELRREQSGVEQEAGKSQQLQQVLLAVNGLPPKCRDVFVLRMIEGLSQREIAERLGISVSTVEKHLARGLRQCRSAIAGRDVEAATAMARPEAATGTER